MIGQSDSPEVSQHHWRRWLPRVALSGILLGVLFWLLPTDQIVASFIAIPIVVLAMVVVGFLLGHCAAALKWWLLLGGTAEVAYPRALRAHFAGLGANLFLPGVVGGDVVRVGLLFRGATDKVRVGVGSIADRLGDVVALLVLAIGGGVVALSAMPSVEQQIGRLVLIFVGLAVLGGLALAFGLRFLRTGRFADKVDRIIQAMAALWNQPVLLLSCLGISLAVQALFVGLTVLLAEAAGLHLSLGAWYFAWPLAKLVASVPISLAGLGIREAGLVALLLPFGADPAAVVAVSLVWQAVLVVGGLAGGCVLAASGWRNR